MLGAADALKKMSLPLREPSYTRPPFWALTFNETRTRPVAAGSGWLDYIFLQLGEQPGLAPVGHSLVINQFIATGESSPITSGLLYRFIIRGARQAVQEFNITNNIERHVDHAAALPWPAMQRRIYLHLSNQQQLVLQVNNTGDESTRAFASLSGWYYPNLRDSTRGQQEVNEDGHESRLDD